MAAVELLSWYPHLSIEGIDVAIGGSATPRALALLTTLNNIMPAMKVTAEETSLPPRVVDNAMIEGEQAQPSATSTSTLDEGRVVHMSKMQVRCVEQ